MEPVFLGEDPSAFDALDFLLAHVVFASVDGDHDVQAQIEQEGRHGGHEQHVKVRDL